MAILHILIIHEYKKVIGQGVRRITRGEAKIRGGKDLPRCTGHNFWYVYIVFMSLLIIELYLHISRQNVKRKILKSLLVD